MANKIEAVPAVETNPDGKGWTLETFKEDVEDIVEMVDYFRTKAFRGENLIRSEAVDGALQMISGRLRMALGDF